MNEMNLGTRHGNGVQAGCNDSGVCFLGETDSLITYSDLSTHFGVTQGTVNNTSQTNRWLHFKIDNKELYISKVVVKYDVSWDNLYSKGLVFGTNDNGLHPTGTPRNQLKTITLNGRLYKCRLLKGANENQAPYTHIPGIESTYYDPPNAYTSEWNRLFYPLITNDPYAKSYTGPKLASYTETDLEMRLIFNWCQESEISSTIYRIIRGYYGPSHLAWVTSSFAATIRGWRACLELVP